MSTYMDKLKALKDALSTPALFLLTAGTSSVISSWCFFALYEWGFGK